MVHKFRRYRKYCKYQRSTEYKVPKYQRWYSLCGTTVVPTLVHSIHSSSTKRPNVTLVSSPRLFALTLSPPPFWLQHSATTIGSRAVAPSWCSCIEKRDRSSSESMRLAGCSNNKYLYCTVLSFFGNLDSALEYSRGAFVRRLLVGSIIPLILLCIQ